MRAANVNNLDVFVLHEFFVAAVSVVNTKLGRESASRIYCTAGNSNDLGVLGYVKICNICYVI
jgi:hypothetical protein